jgi:peroxiredoxin
MADPTKPPGLPNKAGAGRLRTVVVIAVTTVVVVAGVWLVNGGVDGKAVAPSASAGGVSQVELAADQSGPAPKVGEPAPDLTAFDTKGQAVVLEELRGKPVWLVFGATWCTNCRAEMPDVAKAVQSAGDDAHVVAIYVGEGVDKVTGYAERLGLEFPQVADSYTDIGSRYRVMGIPAHFFIDPEGIITAIDVGQLTTEQALDRLGLAE